MKDDSGPALKPCKRCVHKPTIKRVPLKLALGCDGDYRFECKCDPKEWVVFVNYSRGESIREWNKDQLAELNKERPDHDAK